MNALEATKNRTNAREDFYHRADERLKSFIKQTAGIDASRLKWVNTRLTERLDEIGDSYAGVVNFQRVNNITRINKFFEQANRTLDFGDFFVICMETNRSRRHRILSSMPKVLSWPKYCLDFFFRRVFSKLSWTKNTYFKITKGKDRVMSLTEGLGRLSSCGFSADSHIQIGNLTYIISKKTGLPAYDLDPTYGLLVKLNRIGKDREEINVYKFRTMHPYSEYMQEYMFEKNGTKDGDKVNNDFRVTGWGHIFRKFWIDELPMIFNYLKGDLKIVGVRPLSRHKFNTYPEYLQDLRTRFKPGLVPPYYADLPNTVEEFYNSEENYLLSYSKAPIRTDLKYFFKAFYNIFLKSARSK